MCVRTKLAELIVNKSTCGAVTLLEYMELE